MTIREFYCEICGCHIQEIENRENLQEMYLEQEEERYCRCDCGKEYYYDGKRWQFYGN